METIKLIKKADNFWLHVLTKGAQVNEINDPNVDVITDTLFKISIGDNKQTGVYSAYQVTQVIVQDESTGGGEEYFTTIEDLNDRLSQLDYVGFSTPSGGSEGGDMTKAVYDPTNVEADAFSMGNMVETASAKILTDTERNKISNAEETTNKAQPNGYASLDGGGKIPLTQIPVSVTGGITVIGFWDADTNTPDLSSLTLNQGEAYQVSVAGNTTLNGESNWNAKDLAVWNDSLAGNWFKLINAEDVLSVNGKTGTVVLDADDIDDTSTSNKFVNEDEKTIISTFLGIGTTAERNAETPTVGSVWLNTERNVYETWDGDLWMNPDGVKVRNQTGGTVLVGQPMELDGSVDGSGLPDARYAGFAQNDILGVVADAGGSYGDGDYLLVVTKGTYPIYSSFTVTVGQFIRSLGGGDTDSLNSINIGTFAQAIRTNPTTPDTTLCVLFGAVRF